MPVRTFHRFTAAVAASCISYLAGAFDLRSAEQGFHSDAAGKEDRSSMPESPEAPVGLRISERTQATIKLEWEAETGASTVVGYKLYENVRINRFRSQWRLKADGISALTTEVANLKPGSRHEYAIVAVDRNGRESERSFSVVATTLQAPIAFHPIHRSDQKADAIVNEAFRYDVDAVGIPPATFSLVVGPDDMVVDPDSGIVEWTPAEGDEGPAAVSVKATNSEGSGVHSFSVTVHPIGTDLKVPESVRVAVTRDISEDGVTLKWRPAADNVAVVGYRILGQRFGRSNSLFLAGNSVGPTTTYSVTGLKAETRYRFWIQPYDAAGNLANISGIPPIMVTTRSAEGVPKE